MFKGSCFDLKTSMKFRAWVQDLMSRVPAQSLGSQGWFTAKVAINMIVFSSCNMPLLANPILSMKGTQAKVFLCFS